MRGVEIVLPASLSDRRLGAAAFCRSGPKIGQVEFRHRLVGRRKRVATVRGVELVEPVLPEPLLPDVLVVTAGVVLVELLLAGITLLMAGVVLLVELPVSTEAECQSREARASNHHDRRRRGCRQRAQRPVDVFRFHAGVGGVDNTAAVDVGVRIVARRTLSLLLSAAMVLWLVLLTIAA